MSNCTITEAQKELSSNFKYLYIYGNPTSASESAKQALIEKLNEVNGRLYINDILML